MIYQCETDLLRQREAMRVLSSHFKRDFVEHPNPRTGPWDFRTDTRGCVCEHKYRDYMMEECKKLDGGIWFETQKYDALMQAAEERGDTPLFVVTLKNGYVLYADARLIDTSATSEASRPKPRDEFDTDPTYVVPLTMFRGAGKARIFHRP